MKTLPKTIFVEIVCPVAQDAYLVADTSIDDFSDGALIGEYTLTARSRKRVVHQLEVIKKRNKTK